MFRKLTYASLALYIISLAATQTAYGRPFLSLRWIGLIAFTLLGCFCVFTKESLLPNRALHLRVSVYFFIWALTAINCDFPLFSLYRLSSHALVVVACLVFLPQVIQIQDGAKILSFLKILVALTLAISWVRPAPLTSLDVDYQFRGIFGNSNSLGHVAAIGCLLFVHGFLSKSATRMGQLQLAMAAFSAFLLIRSGARSSFAALTCGVVALILIRRSAITRNLVIAWAAIFACLAAAVILRPRLEAFIYKRTDANRADSHASLLSTRLPTLSASLEAFEERPIFGWGFGVDKDTDASNWHGDLKAVGFTGRDALNDLTFTLETGGLAGCAAYFFMLSAVQAIWIKPRRFDGYKQRLRRREFQILQSALNAQQAFACLALLLAVLFEFDDTALSAGSFPSVLLWLSLGIGISIRCLLNNELPKQMLRTHMIVPNLAPTGDSFAMVPK